MIHQMLLGAGGGNAVSFELTAGYQAGDLVYGYDTSTHSIGSVDPAQPYINAANHVQDCAYDSINGGYYVSFGGPGMSTDFTSCLLYVNGTLVATIPQSAFPNSFYYAAGSNVFTNGFTYNVRVVLV